MQCVAFAWPREAETMSSVAASVAATTTLSFAERVAEEMEVYQYVLDNALAKELKLDVVEEYEMVLFSSSGSGVSDAKRARVAQ